MKLFFDPHTTLTIRLVRTISSLFVLAAILSSCGTARDVSYAEADKQPRNVILFISDGCGPASFTLARDFLRNQHGTDSLVLDAIQVGSVRTYSSDEIITDSASSATAYSCGVKTRNGMIGMTRDSARVASVVEVVQARGVATGLVATSRITHATPAAFSSHVVDRGMESEIASQQIESGVDVLFGGGRRFFISEELGGSRTDRRNLLQDAAAGGYSVATSLDEFRRASATPVLALLADDHMPYEIDRDENQTPGLAEMTRKAIALLSGDPDGFFLMVEGSRIDHAAHDHDLGGHLHDILAYDEAVREGLEFAREDGNTLVVSVSDHETGGVTLGRSVGGSSAYAWYPEVAARLSASTDSIKAALLNRSEPVDTIMERLAGISDLTDTERAALEAATSGDADEVIGRVVGERARVGWTTGGHTAVDVNLYAWGPGSERLGGNMENDALGRVLLDLMR